MLRAYLLSICLATLSWAQIGTSTITGRVTDASAAVLPGANVTIVQKGTNFTFNATTNEEGLYRVVSLQPGSYRVTVEAGGFKRAIFDDVTLRVGDTLAVDVAMQLGQLTETVEVASTAPLLETETSATGSVMSGNTLYELPLYQRSHQFHSEPRARHDERWIRLWWGLGFVSPRRPAQRRDRHLRGRR